ncbi:hypothetical protein L226DRAFT_568194 [Lentinus tigrinus ALCF2SS1-7]|uniref:uncharacterized protein n=1 Tax=Lentinus tigrinus ALCF2SS1-7 TaxID=1328758 RepID=UPI00116601E8|nr:hypothetical protein L226DRAFT_568194 [Lentinus tigrinus ALCF2SS1-7]
MPILNELGVLKLPNEDRTHGGARTQNPSRHRKKYVKPTEEQLEKKKQKREDYDTRFAAAVAKARKTLSDLMTDLHDAVPEHTTDWWHQYMMQQPKYTASKRKISRWQAWLSIQMEKRNQALVEEHGPTKHLDRVNTQGLMQTLREEWSTLSEEEKDALTADKIRELEERRDARAHGVRNLSLAKFMDIRETFSSLYNQMENLHDRTGIEIYFAAVRAEHTAYNKPVIYYSSDRVKGFIEMVTNASLSENGVRMEAYCIGGVDGMVSNQLEKTLLLKAKLASLIITKLKDACKRGTIKRMYYDSFDQQITTKHGVVVDNWPIPTFHSPSNMSFIEAEIVLASFENNTTRFRSMPDKEWAAWKQRYLAAAPDHDEDTARAEAAARDEEDDGEPVRILGPSPTRAENSDSTTPDATTPSDAIPSASGAPAPALDNGNSAATTGQKRAAEGDSSAAAPQKRARPAPLAVNFINSVNPVAGGSFQPPKARKTRSDKGKKRKKAGENVQGAAPAVAPSAAAPAVAPSAAAPSAAPPVAPSADRLSFSPSPGALTPEPENPFQTPNPSRTSLNVPAQSAVMTESDTVPEENTRTTMKSKPKPRRKRTAPGAALASAPQNHSGVPAAPSAPVAPDPSQSADNTPLLAQALPQLTSLNPSAASAFSPPQPSFPPPLMSGIHAPPPADLPSHSIPPNEFSFEPSSTFQFNTLPTFQFTPALSIPLTSQPFPPSPGL